MFDTLPLPLLSCPQQIQSCGGWTQVLCHSHKQIFVPLLGIGRFSFVAQSTYPSLLLEIQLNIIQDGPYLKSSLRLK